MGMGMGGRRGMGGVTRRSIIIKSRQIRPRRNQEGIVDPLQPQTNFQKYSRTTVLTQPMIP